jgi:hypothetical protein
MTAAMSLSAAAIVAVLALAWWFLNRPPCMHSRVIANLKNDPDMAVSGLLADVRGDWFVFKDVTMLRADGRTTPFDGECVLHRDNVAWVQVPPTAGR